MATSKKRINVTLNPEVEESLKLLAERDSMSQSAKAQQLMKVAIELDEEAAIIEAVEKRDHKTARYFDHQDVWK